MRIRKIAIGDEVVELVDKNEIGDLEQLTTQDKTSLVGAINSIQKANILELVEVIYPVGAVITSLDAYFNPNDSYQGTTWEKIKAGVFLETTQTASDVGKEVSAGLPNITGYFNFVGFNTRTYADGALYIQSKGAEATTGWGGDSYKGVTGQVHIGFNGANSNGIYGRSSTVQPPAIKCFIWKRTA